MTAAPNCPHCGAAPIFQASPAQEVDETERLRAQNVKLRAYIAASANNVNIAGSAYDEAIAALDRLVKETKSGARAALSTDKGEVSRG